MSGGRVARHHTPYSCLHIDYYGGGERPPTLRFLRIRKVVLALPLCAAAVLLISCQPRNWRGDQKLVILGIDGMDPILTKSMMAEGLLPNLAKLRQSGAFSPLGTSIPPQSPVAWANFINGAGPGSHGIFDFIHRHPEHQCAPFYSASESLPGSGSWDVGDHRLQLDFWPFNHKPPATVLRRQGTPFWDYLDAAGIPSTFYDLPSNYPASPSHFGHHRCICGMGTPDMLGTYGTYQYFAQDAPDQPLDEGGGKRSKLTFVDETARASIVGPEDSLKRTPVPITVSIGLATWDGESAEEFLQRADEALYAAKDAGRNRVLAATLHGRT